jgi:hypothetical protein
MSKQVLGAFIPINIIRRGRVMGEEKGAEKIGN